MKRFIKYMLVPFDNASRNKRELSVVKDFGCEIIVCATGDKESIKKKDGYVVYQRANRLSKNSFVRKIQIIYNWVFKEPRYLKQKKGNYISCHDLIALFIGWRSTWFIPSKKKPKLIYDSHEFEIARNRERSRLATFIIPRLEKFLMKKCAFSMMVNDSIANEVLKIHKLKERPVVVRNIPNYWNIDQTLCKKRREEICERLEVPTDTFIIMYHGVISNSRGLETLLEAVKLEKSVVAMILGNGKASYLQQLKRLAEELKIEDRVLIHDSVPIDILWQYVGAADVGMITIPAVTKSYYFMLPNKFFENIQSLTPVICSNFPEVSQVVNKYDIGLLVNPENIEEIVEAIKKMRTDKKMYYRFKKNLVQAKEELCWENERKILKEAYEKIFD